MSHQTDLYRVQPWVIARNCGGWLAVTPRGWPLSIGVIADTEEAVKEKFAASLARWESIDLGLTNQACGT